MTPEGRPRNVGPNLTTLEGDRPRYVKRKK